MTKNRRPLVVISSASGAILAQTTLLLLNDLRTQGKIDFFGVVYSSTAREIWREELKTNLIDFLKEFPAVACRYWPEDIGFIKAHIASSSSFDFDCVIVIPASVGFCARLS